ncbi:MAG: HAD-IB family phosphatase [Anaerolineae bacterium]|jgi:phosphoserine phosphatase
MQENNISLKPQWPQPTWAGFDFVIFDCDSTLSTIEGIDELARKRGKFEEVKQMTDAAMEGEIYLQSVYDRRLDLLSPTRAEIRELEHHYRQTLVPDAAEVISILQWLGKELFIVSGGLLAAVGPFGEWLGIPPENIRAVDVYYNRLSGQWWDYQQDRWGQRPDEKYLDPKETPLIESQGKADVVQELLDGRTGRSLLVGDGMSDIAAQPAVDLVLGFGGVVTRQGVFDSAEIFIKSKSLAPVVPLALNNNERAKQKDIAHQAVLNKGTALINAGEVVFK